MTDGGYILMDDAVPGALDVFERSVIHPDNLALVEARLARLRPMSKDEARKAERRVKLLLATLNKSRWNDLVDLDQQSQQELEECVANFKDLAAQIKLALELGGTDTTEMKRELKRLAARGKALQTLRHKLAVRIERLQPYFDEYVRLADALTQHTKILEDRAMAAYEEKQLNKEAKYFAKLVREEFRFNTRCHHVNYDKRGRRRIQVPRIEFVMVGPYSVWMKIATSRRGLFDSWKRLLPYNVDVSGIIHEDTMKNLNVVVGRQVQYEYDATETALYFRINRLDAPGGLPRMVSFATMFEKYPVAKHHLLPYLGVVIEGGKVEWLDFGKQPHVLVAGETRSGKSNCLNCAISTVIQMNTPQEVRLVLIDNKGGAEFGFYKTVPHLLGQMCKRVENVLPTLQMVISLMMGRMERLEAVGAKHILAYNDIVGDEERWPRIVVLVDEMAALLGRGELTKAIHQALNEIAAMGAAAGVHLVLSTQYPGKRVVPTEIKANLVARISFAMTSGSASMTAIDSHDAAQIDAKTPGRALIKTHSKPIQAQTPFIPDEDVIRARDRAMLYQAGPDLFASTPAPAEEDTSEIVVTVATDEAEETTATPAPTRRRFGQDDLVRIVVNQMNGNLGTRPIHEHIKSTFPSVSRNQVKAIVTRIVDAGGVEYEGDWFKVLPNKAGYRLAKQPKGQDADTSDVALSA